MQSLLTYLLTGVVASTAGDWDRGTPPAPFVAFHAGYGSIEVGGPYAGFESHHSRPLPSRLSFYAPVANSLDLSIDYKRRHESQIFFLGLQVDSGPRRLIGWEPWPYVLSPASVAFSKHIDHTNFEISYAFPQTSPGMVAKIIARNRDSQPHIYRLYTHWETSLRTCQSYRLKDRASTSFDASTQTIFARFDDPETGNATILIGNGATPPVQWSAHSDALWRNGRITWIENSDPEESGGFDQQMDSDNHRPAAAFLYEKNLTPGDSMIVVHFLASTTKHEAATLAHHLAENYRDEVATYEKFVTNAAHGTPRFRTGNAILDHSTQWAKAILAANRHFLDGDIVPMPCPAEYNFYFTHDVLMTDLAAANFDAARVRADLLYLAKKVSQENLLPHAYYWKDDGFKTEFAGKDNWNHFWFILVAASYLRHTGDLALLNRLQPMLEKSLSLTLSHIGEDGLLWAEHPDWWDIGKAHGPRAYMTALAIRALQEFVFLGANLKFPAERLQRYVSQATSLTATLSQKLWDEQLGYLINFNHGSIKDDHIYAGSLLAVVFDELFAGQRRQLVTTARQRLYDPQLGLRTADPRDFHLLENEFQFVNHEQGDKGEYLNGGVWPHCSAWYALALQQIDHTDEALEAVLRNTTLDGITRSPQGQPAMYEFRYSDPATSDYGRVDKPSFLWAGGWYLFTLYRLLGAAESPWNLHLLTDLPGQTPEPEFQWLVNGQISTTAFSGRGKYATAIEYDGKPSASLVIPTSRTPRAIKIVRGTISQPYLENLTASLIDAQWNDRQKSLRWQSRAFSGHQVMATMISAQPPKRILVDRKTLAPSAWSVTQEDQNSYRTSVSYSHLSSDCEVLAELAK